VGRAVSFGDGEREERNSLGGKGIERVLPKFSDTHEIFVVGAVTNLKGTRDDVSGEQRKALVASTHLADEVAKEVTREMLAGVEPEAGNSSLLNHPDSPVNDVLDNLFGEEKGERQSAS